MEFRPLPLAQTLYNKYNSLENNMIQDVLVPIAGAFILGAGVIDVCFLPIRYPFYKRKEKKQKKLQQTRNSIKLNDTKHMNKIINYK